MPAGHPTSAGDASVPHGVHTAAGRWAYYPQSRLPLLLPLLRLASAPCFYGKLLLPTLVSALMSPTQTLAKVTPPSPPPVPLIYFLALIVSVIFLPVYFVSPVPSSSPPFLPFFTTSYRMTGTLSVSFISINQGFSASDLILPCFGVCPVHCRMCSSITGLYPLGD